jgi:Zn-finger nucleic acid-binding protein
MNESEVYPCPRCSGVNLTKKFALRKKLRHWSCKKCKGLMLSVDDINKLPFIGSRIIKKHNLENLLGTGDVGSLRCGSCSAKMNEIHIVCKKHDRHSSPIKSVGKVLAGGAAIIGVIFLLVFFAEGGGALPGGSLPKSKEKQKKEAQKNKLKKSEVEIVTIDGCNTCASFWFDGGELEKLKVAKILTKYSGMTNEDLKQFRIDSEKRYANLVGFTSKEDKIEWEKISSPETETVGKNTLPKGKIVGKIIGKDTPSEGMMILNRKTNKWDFIREGKIIGKDTPSEGVMTLNKKTKKWDFVPKSKDN